jgi:DNA-binding beta-propeller fold protein YncE
MRFHGHNFFLSIVRAALLLSGSCVSAQPAALRPVWPPLPAVARVRLESCLASPAECGAKPTLAERVVEFLTGARYVDDRFEKPFGVAVDERGNLCVTDLGSGVVWFFDRGAERAYRWDQIERVRFVQPVAVAKVARTIYVADSGLGQVVAFDESGRLRFRISSPLQRPVGIAVAGERLYVVDALENAVLVFDLSGRALSRFGQRGTAPGTFNFPTHVAADGRGRIFVTDSLNARVQIFSNEGRVLGVIGSAGDGSGHFSRPKGVAADSHGHVYVADALFDNIQIFDGAGAFLLDVGSSGSNPGEFWLPSGLAISRDNQIIVADTANRRVQVLRYLDQP